MNESKYETICILRGDLTDEGAKKVSDKIAEIIGRNQGQIEQIKDLGRKPMAYRIANQTKGHYFQLNYNGGSHLVQELEKNLGFSEEVIRFLTVTTRRPRGVPL